VSGGCKCRLPAEGKLTALPRKMPGSEGPIQGGGNRGGREGREAKKIRRKWTGKQEKHIDVPK